MGEHTLWSIDGARLLPLAAIVEDQDGAVMLHEYRPPQARDLPDFAGDVASVVGDWLHESESLATDDGDRPELDEPAFAAAIRATLAAALAEHVDLSEAAWQPTGRVMTVGEALAGLAASGVMVGDNEENEE